MPNATLTTIEPETETIAAVLEGDTERFAMLVDRYHRHVYGIAWSCLRNADWAEDVVQETFVLVYQNLGSLRSPERFPAWISAIARSVAIRHGKRHRRETQTVARAHAENAMHIQSDDAPEAETEVLSALAQLAPVEREALTLFYMQGLNVKRCAEQLGVTEAAFKVRLHRARKALRAEYSAAAEATLTRQSTVHLRGSIMEAVAAAAAAGKSGASFGFAKVMGLFPWLLLLIPWSVVYWQIHSLGKSYAEGAEVRQGVLGRNFLILSIAVVVLVSALGVSGLHPLRVFGILGTYVLLCTLLMTAAPLSLAHPSARWGMVCNVFAGCVFIGIAWFDWRWELLPIAFSLHAFIVPRDPAMLKADHSLFLRLARGTLNTAELDHGPDDSRNVATSQDVMAFAWAMARRSLVQDSKRVGEGIRLCLNPVVMNPFQSMLAVPPRYLSYSSVMWHPADGWSCSLSTRDQKSLRSLGLSADITQLERQLSRLMAEAFHRWMTGSPDDAIRMLDPQSTEDVFLHDPYSNVTLLKYSRWINSMTVITILGFLYFTPARLTNDPWGPPLVIDAKLAHRAIELYVSDINWSWSPRAHSLVESLEQPEFPPARFLYPKLAARLRTAILEKVLAHAPGDSDAWIEKVILQPRVVRNALVGGYITADDLRQLGLTDSRVSQTLRALRERGIVDSDRISDSTWPQRNDDLRAAMADRAEIFAALGCTHLLDVDAICSATAARFSYLFPIELKNIGTPAYKYQYVTIDTHDSLRILKALGGLSRIDRQVCVASLQQLLNTVPADFWAKEHPTNGPDFLYGAIQSLNILGATCSTKGFENLLFKPTTGYLMVAADRNSTANSGQSVLPKCIKVWAYSEVLKELQKQCAETSQP